MKTHPDTQVLKPQDTREMLRRVTLDHLLLVTPNRPRLLILQVLGTPTHREVLPSLPSRTREIPDTLELPSTEESRTLPSTRTWPLRATLTPMVPLDSPQGFPPLWLLSRDRLTFHPDLKLRQVTPPATTRRHRRRPTELRQYPKIRCTDARPQQVPLTLRRTAQAKDHMDHPRRTPAAVRGTPTGITHPTATALRVANTFSTRSLL